MREEEDYSLETDTEVQAWMSTSAQSEYQETIERLKYDRRRSVALYLRSLGRHERLKLRAKYAAK